MPPTCELGFERLKHLPTSKNEIDLALAEVSMKPAEEAFPLVLIQPLNARKQRLIGSVGDDLRAIAHGDVADIETVLV